MTPPAQVNAGLTRQTKTHGPIAKAEEMANLFM
jgi:hypothetical protein